METKKVKISIVVLSWNTKKLLRDCLNSLNESLTGNLTVEVIVVDNASNDGSIEMIKKEFPEIRLIMNKENLGYGKGNNVGINAAKGSQVMILNSDTLVKKGTVEKLSNFLDDNKQTAIVGPKLLNIDNTPQANCGRFPGLFISFVMLYCEHLGLGRLVRWSPQKSQPVDWLMGAAFMARNEVFEKVDGFDKNIFMYMEEVEWFYRAKKAGFSAYFLKEAEVIHLGRGSSKSGKTEPILNIYRGIIYFFKKHKSVPEQVILLFLLKLIALLALTLGYIKNDGYLKETYGQAIKIN